MGLNPIPESEIARSIILAQIASDSGKGIYTIQMHNENENAADKSVLFSYSIKEFHILRAIDKINCSKKCNFNYWVEQSPDQNGYDSIIVYFDIKLMGKRKQVSFHTPLNKSSKKLRSFVNKGRKTRWQKNCSSRETCKSLVEFYSL